ncbi:class I SAM-dependent methyltransferase [Rubripirellula reticaptiva]|uniref:class I SAM-dependent methyltransferase n=1 Tax=Rubripirellula reticaptiva TaxID=2528013 RepID=UPI0016454190|nr:class I SAM-dependent methyltransferase [Rubripirellula reticaptiva]
MGVTETSDGGYDRIARPYRWLEWIAFGQSLQHSRICLLSELPLVDRILVMGDGDGRLLQQICRSQPGAEITSVDQSLAMIDLQKSRVASAGATDRVRWVCADGRQFSPASNEYDLLVTAFYLDCFTEFELGQHLPRWLSGVKNGGFFYVAEFVQPTSGWRAIRARVMLAAMHLFFRRQTSLTNHRLVDLTAIFDLLPIDEVNRAERSGNMIRTQIFSVR